MRQVLRCLIVSTCTAISGYSAANIELPPARQIEVATVKGAQISGLLGKNMADNNYSVMAISDGKLVPIPFQFDDIDIKGFPFVPGGVLEVKGEEDIFEAHDELAFMLKDIGEKATQEQKAAVSGKVLNELEFAAGINGSIYAYVVEGNSERSDVRYVSFNKETGLVKTESYSLQISPDNALVWSDFFYEGFKSDETILDTMKLRIRAKLGFISATLSNRLIPNNIQAVKDGPVRNVISVDATIGILGVNFAHAGAAVTLNRDSLEFPVFVTIPSAASILSSLDIDISLDFNDLDGAKVRTALGPAEPIIAGSSTPNTEHKVTLEDNWLSGSSGKNWDIIAIYNGSDNFEPSMKFLYKDKALGDKADKPERFKGSSPQVGYVVGDIPTGIDAVIGINLYFSEDFWSNGGLETATEQVRKPLVATVTNESAININVGEL